MKRVAVREIRALSNRQLDTAIAQHLKLPAATTAVAQGSSNDCEETARQLVRGDPPPVLRYSSDREHAAQLDDWVVQQASAAEQHRFLRWVRRIQSAPDPPPQARSTAEAFALSFFHQVDD